ncbi:Imm9 family immunity protein [Myroides sp. LJL116]
MNKNIKVSMPIEIPDLRDDVDIESIEKDLNAYLKTLVQDVNIQDLNDWRLLISVVSRSTDKIGVFKRAKRFPSDKEFEISISIPIPNCDQANYGLQQVKDCYYMPINDKNFHSLNPNFEQYSSLYDYILTSSRKAINLAFTQGFTCNGKKIILKK